MLLEELLENEDKKIAGTSEHKDREQCANNVILSTNLIMNR